MQNIKFKQLTTVLLLICLSTSNCQTTNSRLLGALLPRIDQPEFQLIPRGQRYNLSIYLPDGSNRMENGELLAPGTPDEELFVTGTINEIFSIGNAVTIYEAGRNGYTVKYTYTGGPPLLKPLYISPTGLKSAAG